MEKPYYLGLPVLDLKKVLLYGTHYDTFQPYFGHDDLKLHYMDCVDFLLSIRTQKSLMDSQNFEGSFVFSNLNKNHELFCRKNKKKLLENLKLSFLKLLG